MTWLCATNEKTVIAPLGPEYRFHFTPAIVGVATTEPVEEMGLCGVKQGEPFKWRSKTYPAPPKAASQIMISYEAEPVAEEEVKRS